MSSDPFKGTSNPDFSRFIHVSRYARYRDDLGRRETWEETVNRLIDFWAEKLSKGASEDLTTDPDALNILDELYSAIYNLEIMPSMRSVMTAGKALERDHVAGYNCSYLPIDHPRAFDEMMYILMCGTGVGYSVERQYVSKLPEISEEFHDTDSTIVFADSKIGWASGFRELISLLYAGKVPRLDFGKIRESGARLKTFGGRASGPEPLKDLCNFTISLFTKAAGRKLTSIECHDLCCKIADIVVVGGVRRSALISLSNVSDDRMRVAKSGQWWNDNPQRALANNSACYTEKPEFEVFLDEWRALYESKSGERGIFSRMAAEAQLPERREGGYEWGTNPCSEIVLRPNSFCNLSEVVVRPDDTLETLRRKVGLATILGTLQSTLTDFRYLRKVWKDNTEEERLLGVSLTGIMDHPVLNGGDSQEENDDNVLKTWLESLRDEAIRTNNEWSEKLGIPPSAATNCIKPSGTVSQLVDSSSGIHPRYSPYYLRTVRADTKDPLSQFLIDQGVRCEEDVMNPHNYVFYFPMKAPEGSVTGGDMGAIEQLKLWETYQDHWCEHKPSMTCYYKDNEFLEVGQWVWEKFNKLSGVSFLPYTDHVYKQAPYIPISEEEYQQAKAEFPAIDWDKFPEYENENSERMGAHELACSAGHCEV